MKLAEDVTNPKKKGVKLNPLKATKSTIMSLQYTVIRKLSQVIRNQKRNSSNLKLVVAWVSSRKKSFMLEFSSDNTADYPNEEFIDVIDEDDIEQAGSDEEEGDKFVGDHGVGDPEDDEEEDERVDPKGFEYEEGDD